MKHARADYDRIQDPAELIPIDEPVFLIRGRDPVSADAVRAWAELHELAGGDPALSDAARRHALRMQLWHEVRTADAPPGALCDGETKGEAMTGDREPLFAVGDVVEVLNEEGLPLGTVKVVDVDDVSLQTEEGRCWRHDGTFLASASSRHRGRPIAREGLGLTIRPTVARDEGSQKR